MTEKFIIKRDANFCKTLMDRLYDDLMQYCCKEDAYIVDGHTVIQADIKRLRRELSNLYKELNYYD